MDNDPKNEVMSPKALLGKVGLPKPDQLSVFEESLKAKAGLVTKSAGAVSDTSSAVGDLFSDGTVDEKSAADQAAEVDAEVKEEKERKIASIMSAISELQKDHPDDGDYDGIISGNMYTCHLHMLVEGLESLGVIKTDVLPQLTDDVCDEIRTAYLGGITSGAAGQLNDPDYIGTFNSRFGFNVNGGTNLGGIASVSTFLSEPGCYEELKKLSEGSEDYQGTLKLYMAKQFKRMLARNYANDYESAEINISPITIGNARLNYHNELADWLGEMQRLGLDVKDVLGKEIYELFSVVSGDHASKKAVPDDIAKEYFRVLMATTHENSYSPEFLAKELGAYDGPPHVPGSPDAPSNTWARFYAAHAEHFGPVVEVTTKNVIDPRKLGAREVTNE